VEKDLAELREGIQDEMQTVLKFIESRTLYRIVIRQKRQKTPVVWTFNTQI
jgi:hypothetical protein